MNTEIISKQAIQDELMDFLCRQFFVDYEDIETDKSLVDTGIIDSMGLIEISSYIQKSHGFKVTQEQMNRDNFGSVIKIVDFIHTNISSRNE
ncbi:acyl carrier protein [Saccharicrinis sp. FJH54]|uniref:acyl carrier protein n=1 Tax=Saccharicrinis sp. FJH54 TaxID=3344665 RepID=UPI0035D3F59E